MFGKCASQHFQKGEEGRLAAVSRKLRAKTGRLKKALSGFSLRKATWRDLIHFIE